MGKGRNYCICLQCLFVDDKPMHKDFSKYYCADKVTLECEYCARKTDHLLISKGSAMELKEIRVGYLKKTHDIINDYTEKR